MVKKYLVDLKNKGNFSWSDLSEMSGIPDATIRKIFSGETADPRFDTVAKLVVAMGGSLDEIIEGKKENEIEKNAIVAIKEVYEARINDLKESSADIVGSLKRDKKLLATALFVVGLAFIAFLMVDVFIGSVGWFRY